LTDRSKSYRVFLIGADRETKEAAADILTDTGKIVFTASVVAPFFQNAPVSSSFIVAGVIIAVGLYVTALFLDQ